MKGSQICSICTNINREAIEHAMQAHVRYREIAKQFATSAATLTRHKAHMEGSGGPADTPKEILDAVDAGIAELRVLMRRGRKHKNKTVGTELALKASRELRAWISLRAQLARRQPIPVEESEQLDEQQLADMAQALVEKRGKEKPN
jgi:hypothetical protein